MRRFCILNATVVLLSASSIVSSSPIFSVEALALGEKDHRVIDLRYEVEIAPADLAKKKVQVFIPLALSGKNQQILHRTIDANISGSVKRESVYGNEFWQATVDLVGKTMTVDGKQLPMSVEQQKVLASTGISINVKYRVRRRPNIAGAKRPIVDVDPAQFPNNPHYLLANKRVPIKGKLITDIIKDLPKFDGSELGTAKAIYNFVVDNMEYKKVGEGWGNGSTEWACSEKYGNCTDFHALFISLARSQKITSRFKMGFPVPESMTAGTIPGYHCWVEFYIPKVGWVPVDASEAKKNIAQREFYFGSLPADRIQFSIGRDIVLNADQKSAPLNYFIYPLIEVGGKAKKVAKTTVTFKEIEATKVSRK